MKIKRVISVLGLAVAMGICTKPITASANELILNQNYIINQPVEGGDQIEKIDRASKSELEAYDTYRANSEAAYKANPKTFDAALVSNDLNKLSEEFGKEFDQRYELAKQIELSKKIDNPSFDMLIKDAIRILNSNDLEAIKNTTTSLIHSIDEYKAIEKDQAKLANIKIEASEKTALEEDIQNFLNDGKLVFAEKLEDIEKLNLQKESILNSVTYYKADDSLKEKYDDVLSNLDSEDIATSLAYLEDFIQTEDKANFETDLISEASEFENIKFNASNDSTAEGSVEETTTLENTNQTTSSESNQSSGSAFLNNDATSVKYNELSDAQKRELDAIDSNKDGKLSDDEINNSANYAAPLPDSSWLYPFTEEGQASGSTETTATNNQSDSTNTQTSESTTTTQTASDDTDASTETASPAADRPMPGTVTIDDNQTRSPELAADQDNDSDDADEVEEETEEEEAFNEAAASAAVEENTQAASIVKTGITGLGIVVAILIVAVIAYFIVNNNQKKNKTDRRNNHEAR